MSFLKRLFGGGDDVMNSLKYDEQDAIPMEDSNTEVCVSCGGPLTECLNCGIHYCFTCDGSHFYECTRYLF